MSREFPQLDALKVEVRPDARDRHLKAIASAVAEAKPRRPRYRLLAVAIAVVFLLPVIALAADNAQPGDLLYPIREAMGWVEQAPVDSPSDLSDAGFAEQRVPTVPLDGAGSIPDVEPSSRANASDDTTQTRVPEESDRVGVEARDRQEESTSEEPTDRPTEDASPPHRRGDRP